MRRHRLAREAEVDPFYDMLFNMLIAFVFCFIIALLAMNPKALKAGDIPSKAEFIVNLSWPDMNPDDIDTWVQDPAGNLVWFRAREAGLMHLDRDDRDVHALELASPLQEPGDARRVTEAPVGRHPLPVAGRLVPGRRQTRLLVREKVVEGRRRMRHDPVDDAG